MPFDVNVNSVEMALAVDGGQRRQRRGGDRHLAHGKLGIAPDDLRSIPLERLTGSSSSDGQYENMADPIEETVNHRRKLPGEGEFDIRGYVEVCRDMGYPEPVGSRGALGGAARPADGRDVQALLYDHSRAVRAGRRVARSRRVEWEEALGLLRTMWRIRLFEERVGQLKRADEVHGLIHLSVGQEGVAAGVCTQLRDDDAVYSGHRAHGHAIARGRAARAGDGRADGPRDGLCRGLGGSMHLVDVEHGLMGATGVVGGNIPMALGSALAARLGGGDQVAVVFFGDGAVQAGHFNESVNLATLWELPVDASSARTTASPSSRRAPRTPRSSA